MQNKVSPMYRTTPYAPPVVVVEKNYRSGAVNTYAYHNPYADAGFDQDQFAKDKPAAAVTFVVSHREPVMKSSLPVKKSLVSTVEHQVNKGETLWSIARQYRTTVEQLIWLNNLSNNQIRTGKILRVK